MSYHISRSRRRDDRKELTERQTVIAICGTLFITGLIFVVIAAAAMYSVRSCDLNTRNGCTFHNKVAGLVVENNFKYYKSKTGSKIYYAAIKLQLLNNDTHQTCMFTSKEYLNNQKGPIETQKDFAVNSTAIVLQDKKHLSHCIRISEGLYSWDEAKTFASVGASIGGFGLICIVAWFVSETCAKCERRVPTLTVAKWTDTVVPIQELAFVRVGVQEQDNDMV